MRSLAGNTLLAAFSGFVSLASIASPQTPVDLRAMVGKTWAGRVTSVVDGDTIDVRLASGARVRVRLEGIDAPEKGAPFSTDAVNATRVLLFDQTASIRATDVDVYGRLVARVTANGRDSSLALVRDGFACHFTRYSSDRALAAAQEDARTAGRGLWRPGTRRPAACAQPMSAPPARITSPPAPRRDANAEAAAPHVIYHGNRRSKVYHAPSCPNYNCPNCVVEFRSHDEAQSAGFRPADDCLR